MLIVVVCVSYFDLFGGCLYLLLRSLCGLLYGCAVVEFGLLVGVVLFGVVVLFYVIGGAYGGCLCIIGMA